MDHLIYGELARFYHLLDPLEDHADEALAYGKVLLGAAAGAQSLLELGSGAGNGAYYLKTLFATTTLTDLSEPMLELSRRQNPDCEHILGDMRTLRLHRSFDCVFVHDAICYLTTESDLRACFDTAYQHLRSGGAALFVPDSLKETFRECHEDHADDDEELSLRCISWCWDPDPTDLTHRTEYAFLLREDGVIRARHDTHVHGLFPRATWQRLLEEAGFAVEVVTRAMPDEYLEMGYCAEMFLARKR